MIRITFLLLFVSIPLSLFCQQKDLISLDLTSRFLWDSKANVWVKKWLYHNNYGDCVSIGVCKQSKWDTVAYAKKYFLKQEIYWSEKVITEIDSPVLTYTSSVSLHSKVINHRRIAEEGINQNILVHPGTSIEGAITGFLTKGLTCITKYNKVNNDLVTKP